MGSVTVDFQAYQTGQLPGVCVLTGVDTEDRMTLRTQIIERTSSVKEPGLFTSSLDRFIANLDPRRPRDLLLGHLPVDPSSLAALQARSRGWRAAVWLQVALALVAMAIGAVWSPYVVTLAAAGIVYASAQLRSARASAPRPTLIGAGSKVFLENVHERFISAVEETS